MSADSLFDVSREVVLITGVSGQLGNEYAKAFLQRGAQAWIYEPQREAIP